MPVAAVIAFLATWVCLVVFLVLTGYLELRIHALVQSGGLPEEAMKWFRGRWHFSFLTLSYGPDLKFLSSPEFRAIDSHTRRLTPIIRAAYVLALIGLPVSIVLGLLG